ncbi:MAG: hypothetical protein KGV51_04730 [Moraxellaceae bacterium]|nr:hypothetical protein [Moraxellaceae bacterium]
MIVYNGLEKCRLMMSQKSVSDFSEVKGTGADNHGIAEGVLAKVKMQCPSDLNKLLYCYLIDSYIQMISDKDYRHFINLSERMVLKMLKKRGMRKKRAGQIIKVALHCLLVEDLNNASRARLMKVEDDNYCRRYRDVVDDLLSTYYQYLSIADNLAWQQFNEMK